jgi:hypothetical protein
MKITSNEKEIDKNTKIGFWSVLVSYPILTWAAILFLISEENLKTSFPMMLIGVILFQIGRTFRPWGRGAHSQFNKALGKLGKEYHIFHFRKNISHLLVGPAGIWLLVPHYSKEDVKYHEKSQKWKPDYASFSKKIGSIFKDRFGRPDMELLIESDTLDKFLQKFWKFEEAPHIDGVIVFMNDTINLDTKNSPIPSIKLSKLKEFFRKKEKEATISDKMIKNFIEVLSE